MRTHPPTIDGKRATDSAGKSEAEICSPQDPIIYLSCKIEGCNCQHDGRKASWDLVSVAALKIRLRLWYLPTSWFQPPYATCHPPPATPLLVPGTCNSASIWIEHPGAYMKAYSQVRLGMCLRAAWELTGSVQSSRLGVCHRVQLGALLRACAGVYWDCTRRCAWEHTRSVLGSVLRAYLAVYRQAGWECVIECNWELRAYSGVCLRASWELTWEHTVKLGVCHQAQLGASLRACPGVYMGAYS